GTRGTSPVVVVKADARRRAVRERRRQLNQRDLPGERNVVREVDHRGGGQLGERGAVDAGVDAQRPIAIAGGVEGGREVVTERTRVHAGEVEQQVDGDRVGVVGGVRGEELDVAGALLHAF